MQTHFKVIANKPYSFVFNLIYDFSIIFMLGFSSEIKGNKKLYIKKKTFKIRYKTYKIRFMQQKKSFGTTLCRIGAQNEQEF